MRAILYISLVLTLLISNSVNGQSNLRAVTEDDYKLWSTVYSEQISDSGNWVSYSVTYASGKDTLFVKNTKQEKLFAFAGSSNGTFANEHFFISQNRDHQLVQTDLKLGTSEKINGLISYTISSDGTHLIALFKKDESEHYLLIRNLISKSEKIISNVSNYSYSADAHAVICDAGSNLEIISLDKSYTKTTVIKNQDTQYSDFVWNKNGKSVAFLIHEKDIGIGYYNISDKKLYRFSPVDYPKFPKAMQIYNSSFTALTISDDGSKVFFGLKPDEVAEESDGVQIWNSEDKMLYPERRVIKGWSTVPKVGVWFTESGQFRMLTDNNFPNMMLAGDQRNALVFDPKGNDPQFNHSAPIDFYLLDINSGDKKLLLERQSPDVNKLTASGSGRFIAYFKDKSWWVYDIRLRIHRNLSEQLGVSMVKENYDYAGEIPTCGIGGWSQNDESVFLYDNYDIWLVKTDGTGYKKLTDGRKDEIKYRMLSEQGHYDNFTNYAWNQKNNYSTSEGILIKAIGKLKSGYFKWNEYNGLKSIVFNSNRISSIKISTVKNVCIYTEEHYNIPPKITVQFQKESKLLFQSNPQYKKFQWGFSKVITYSTSKEQMLQGALFYPAGYTPEKTYPMVIHIYGSQSGLYNQYVNPTLLNNDGFNISNLTTQGYFVLLPDIFKQQGEIGQSAVDCVQSAVEKVLANEVVDPKRLGLIGHSYGGYETNFIISQTNLFAAAISGAAVSDVVNDYLYVAWNILKPNSWRYEFDQANMGVSLFDNYDGYIRNSPITYAKQINTPLLLWAGDKDLQVHYYQSVAMHMALRRLQKDNILLLYEGDRHTIQNRAHQKDLTHKVQDWFDYYLKGYKKPDWLAKDRL